MLDPGGGVSPDDIPNFAPSLLHEEMLGPAISHPTLQKPHNTNVFILGPKDHINIRILHSGSKAPDKGDCRHQHL